MDLHVRYGLWPLTCGIDKQQSFASAHFCQSQAYFSVRPSCTLPRCWQKTIRSSLLQTSRMLSLQLSPQAATTTPLDLCMKLLIGSHTHQRLPLFDVTSSSHLCLLSSLGLEQSSTWMPSSIKTFLRSCDISSFSLCHWSRSCSHGFMSGWLS